MPPSLKLITTEDQSDDDRNAGPLSAGSWKLCTEVDDRVFSSGQDPTSIGAAQTSIVIRRNGCSLSSHSHWVGLPAWRVQRSDYLCHTWLSRDTVSPLGDLGSFHLPSPACSNCRTEAAEKPSNRGRGEALLLGR